MNVLTRKLIAKELYVNRWLVAGAGLCAVLAVAVAPLGQTVFNVSTLVWLTTIIALGVMLAIFGVSNERKENSLQFVLSLPLSIPDYVRAKLVGLTLCFLLPWLAGSIAALLLIFLNDAVPDGLAPYVVLLCVFMLANFMLVLSGAMHVRSDAWMAGIIVLTNMGVSIFMFTIGPLPALRDHMWGPAPVWNATFWTVLACELAVFAIAFALPLLFAARRRDFL